MISYSLGKSFVPVLLYKTLQMVGHIKSDSDHGPRVQLNRRITTVVGGGGRGEGAKL